jgi:Sugar-transfer associated ATP-grasp
MSQLTRLIERTRSLQQVLRDPRRKRMGQMVREAADVTRRTGAYPEWYFLTFAYRREAGPYTEYLARNHYEKLTALRQGEHHAVLEDKLCFHERFRGKDFRLPRLLAHNDGDIFHVGATVRHVGDSRAFAALMGELCGCSATGSVFVKPADGKQGYRCHRVDLASAGLDALYAETLERHSLFEETLAQHPALHAIFPRSVNTVRVVTCSEPGEPPAAIAAILRLGVGQHAVDNVSQGGIFVGVDLETGRLLPFARKLFKRGGDVHATHPDTGFRFEGFEVPHFREVLATAENATVQAPHPLIGWDLAVTETGPVIIEGNTVPGLPIMEAALGRGLMAHPSFRKLWERVAAAG